MTATLNVLKRVCYDVWDDYLASIAGLFISKATYDDVVVVEHYFAFVDQYVVCCVSWLRMNGIEVDDTLNCNDTHYGRYFCRFV